MSRNIVFVDWASRFWLTAAAERGNSYQTHIRICVGTRRLHWSPRSPKGRMANVPPSMLACEPYQESAEGRLLHCCGLCRPRPLGATQPGMDIWPRDWFRKVSPAPQVELGMSSEPRMWLGYLLHAHCLRPSKEVWS